MAPDAVPPLTPLRGVFENASTYLTSRQIEVVLMPLVEFLREHQPHIGQIITGEIEGTWTKKDVRKLEKLILKKAPSVKAIDDFLRVLRKACRYWMLDKRTTLVLPRIPVIPPEVMYPFRANYSKAVARYEAWKRTLAKAILTRYDARDFARGDHGIADLIVSSVLFSGMHSMDQVVALVRAANLPRRVFCVDNRIHVELFVSWHGVPDVELRRLQPDPLTATLLMHTVPGDVKDLLAPLQDQPSLSDKDLAKRLKKLVQQRFRNLAADKDNRLLLGLPALIQAAQVVARKELPVLLAEYAAREFTSQSFPRSTLQRLSKEKLRYLSEPEEAIGGIRVEAPISLGSREVPDTEVPGAHELYSVFKGKQRSEVRKLLQGIRGKYPFIDRVADFGDFLLAVPTTSGKPTTASAARDSIALLIKHMGCHAKGQDIAELPIEKIESIYIQMLEGTGSFTKSTRGARRLRVMLARVLRSFHEYLVVCHKKEQLTDRSILFCGEAISEVAADLLTVEELLEILNRLGLVEDLSPTQRRISRILMILGFHCGLRRAEALYCMIDDIKVDRDGTPVEFFVRSSEFNNVKTPNARRRIPLDVVPADQLEEVSDWYKLRVEEHKAGSDELLFADPDQLLNSIPQTIFQKINSVIRDVTGSNCHFHHARHSAATGLLVRLLLEDSQISEDFFPHLPETSAWLRTGAALRRTLYNHDQPTRKHPYKLAQFLGHGSVRTSYSSYIHMLDWMLSACIRKSLVMCPDIELVRKASGAPRTTLQGWEKIIGPMGIPLNLFRKRAVSDRITGTEHNDRHAPAVKNKRNWANGTRHFLFSAGTWGRPLEEVVRSKCRDPELDLDGEIASARLELARAEYLLKLPSTPEVGRHRMQRWVPDRRNPSNVIELACPLAPVQPHDKEIVQRYAGPLEEMVSSDRKSIAAIVRTALSSYVRRVWRYEHRVLFHNLSEVQEAKNYIAFLRELGILMKDIGWYSFDASVRSRGCIEWRKELSLEDYEIKIIAPNNPEADTSQWFGIMPRFNFEKKDDGTEKYAGVLNPGAYGFRFLMEMAFIKFGKLD